MELTTHINHLQFPYGYTMGWFSNKDTPRFVFQQLVVSKQEKDEVENLRGSDGQVRGYDPNWGYTIWLWLTVCHGKSQP